MLVRFSQLLADSQCELARIVTLEQGKALQESTGEVARASSEASFSAGEALRRKAAGAADSGPPTAVGMTEG